MDAPNLVTRKEAARILGIGIATANRWSYSGLLPTVKLSPRVVRVDMRDLDAMIRARSTATVTEE